MTDRPDVIIIGGGLAGGTAACELAAGGARVVLIEREAHDHHKVCGEFLSAEAAVDLRATGLDLDELSPCTIGKVRMTSGHRQASAVLPFTALSVSRRTLDQALLVRAQSLGVDVRRGQGAKTLIADAEGATVTLAGGEAFAAPVALLATGKHELKGWARPKLKTGKATMIGLKAHLRLTARAQSDLSNTVEIHLFDGGYAGLQSVGPDLANLCLVIAPDRFRTLGGTFDDVKLAIARSNPVLGSRLQDAQSLWERPLAVSGVPYGFRHQPTGDERAPVWRLGDQFAVTPSFTGDGMAIAVRSGRRAAAAILAGETSGGFHRGLNKDVRPQLDRAVLASRLLEIPQLQNAIVAAAGLRPGLLTLGARLTRLAPIVVPSTVLKSERAAAVAVTDRGSRERLPAGSSRR